VKGQAKKGKGVVREGKRMSLSFSCHKISYPFPLAVLDTVALSEIKFHSQLLSAH